MGPQWVFGRAPGWCERPTAGPALLRSSKFGVSWVASFPLDIPFRYIKFHIPIRILYIYLYIWFIDLQNFTVVVDKYG